jgi:hypothetical protein
VLAGRALYVGGFSTQEDAKMARYVYDMSHIYWSKLILCTSKCVSLVCGLSTHAGAARQVVARPALVVFRPGRTSASVLNASMTKMLQLLLLVRLCEI